MKTVISTPFPLPKNTAAEFGVPKKRVRWLASLMDAIREGRDVHAFASTPVPGGRMYTKKKRKAGGSRGRTRKA